VTPHCNGRIAAGIANAMLVILCGLQPASALKCVGLRPIPSVLPLEQRPSTARPDGIAFLGRVDALHTFPEEDGLDSFVFKMHVSKIRAIRGEVPPSVVIDIRLCSLASAKVGDEVLVTGFFHGGNFHAD
jgi:hypothetical protein